VTYFLEGNVVEGRDELTKDDSRLFDRTGRVIDSQDEVGGWPDYRAAGKLPSR